MNKQDSVDLLHPSMLQIQYLMELEKVGKKRGSVTMIADICGVSHGPVSRFFKECMERGYLTEKYEFTAEGTHALLIYKKLLRDQHSRESNAYFIEKILEKGKFQVGIAVHQMSRNSETRISMAHQGFEHLALIRNNTRGSWLS